MANLKAKTHWKEN